MKSVAKCLFEDQQCLNHVLLAKHTDLSSWFKVSLENDAVYFIDQSPLQNDPVVDERSVRVVIFEFGKLFWQFLVPDKSFPGLNINTGPCSIDCSALFDSACGIPDSIQKTVGKILELSCQPNVDISCIPQQFETTFGQLQDVVRRDLSFSGTDSVGVDVSFEYSGLVNSAMNQPHGEGTLKFKYPDTSPGDDPKCWNCHEVRAFFVRGRMNAAFKAQYLIFDCNGKELATTETFVEFTWNTPILPKFNMTGD